MQKKNSTTVQKEKRFLHKMDETNSNTNTHLNLVDEKDIDREYCRDRVFLKALNSFADIPEYKQKQTKYQLVLLRRLIILNFDFCLLPSLLTSTFKESNYQLFSNWLKILELDIGHTAMFKKLVDAGFSWSILQQNFYDCPPRPIFVTGNHQEVYNFIMILRKCYRLLKIME